MRKSTSHTTPKSPSNFTTTPTTNQLTPQQNHNQFQLHSFAVRPNHDPVTHNTNHSPTQTEQPTPHTATTKQHPLLPTNKIQAIMTHPSNAHQKAVDTHYPKPLSIDRSTVCPSNVYQPAQNFCSTTVNHPTPSQCTSTSNEETNNPASASRYTDYPFSPKTKDPHVSKSALNSLPPKDPQNSIMALKEVASSLNKKLN